MANVLSSKKIGAALDKAKNICVCEEAFDLEGNHLVVRNLRPSDYDNISKLVGSLSNPTEAEYLNAWQAGHVCHALVEINGIDLRDVKFIEAEVPLPDGGKETVKLEVPTYLRDHLVSTWGREAVYTAYRKVGDAIARAETTSKDNVKFVVLEETPEEQYRRLLGEVKEIEDEVPPALVDRILEENGLMRKSTAEQIKAALEKDSTEGYAEVQRKKQEAEAVAPPPDPCPGVTFSPVAPRTPIQCELPKGHAGEHKSSNLIWEDPVPVPAPRPTPSLGTPADYTKRQPLNQMVVDVPPPPVAQREAVPAVRPSSKAAQFAALEEAADQIGAIPKGAVGVDMPVEVAELTHKAERRDPRSAMGIVDQPPSVGLNPKFRPMR